jgi:hypothetical protein
MNLAIWQQSQKQNKIQPNKKAKTIKALLFCFCREIFSFNKDLFACLASRELRGDNDVGARGMRRCASLFLNNKRKRKKKLRRKRMEKKSTGNVRWCGSRDNLGRPTVATRVRKEKTRAD